LHTNAIEADDAIRQTVVNTLRSVSANVIVTDTMYSFSMMQRRDLDAFIWLKDATVRSALEREGSLFPSYTSFSSINLKLMRMSGFRGTVDSLMLYGSSSYFAHAIGSSRSRIAKIGAEKALQDLADRLVNALSRDRE
jgi:hypothetical protein